MLTPDPIFNLVINSRYFNTEGTETIIQIVFKRPSQLVERSQERCVSVITIV